MLSDVLVLVIQKIQQGSYVYLGNDPVTFAIEVAKRKAKNYHRQAQRHQTEDLGPMEEISQDILEKDYEPALIEMLLGQLGESCQRLIRLRYLEGIRDKDVIAQGLTQYTTVDALKNQRSKCLKKLINLGKSLHLGHEKSV